jgi:2-polyprenyl-3-methyl-5-hydroxy-6-metoxy-1,4-benzoquinol methylase
LKSKFDVIVCSNVLEHVPSPLKVLRKISKCMNETGILYIEIPYEKIMKDFSGIDLAKTKRHWHEHINFFY